MIQELHCVFIRVLIKLELHHSYLNQRQEPLAIIDLHDCSSLQLYVTIKILYILLYISIFENSYLPFCFYNYENEANLRLIIWLSRNPNV